MATRRQWCGVSMVAGVVFVLAGGCASVPQAASTEPATSRTRFGQSPSQRRLTLTSADLARQTGSALDAIRRLRPEFFFPQTRSAPNPHPSIALYLDNVYDGDVSGLASIPLDAIFEVDFLRPMEAMTRFGTRCRCEGGAIVVKTMKINPEW